MQHHRLLNAARETSPQSDPAQCPLTLSDYLWMGVLWLLTETLRYFLALLLVLGATSCLLAQPEHTGSVFSPGEILQYKVRWGFVRLGTVVISQGFCDSAVTGARSITMDVHSAKGLPFINVHFVNQSLKSPTSLCVTEETITTGEDSSEQTTYRFNPATNTLYCSSRSAANGAATNDSLITRGCFYDALGLLMLARTFRTANSTIIAPTLNEFAVHETEMTFTNQFEDIEVTACDTPIRSRRIEGFARWVGNSFAGMKGPFTGWISDDEASIPLRAEIKIFLGSIVLELESTNRKDWRPNILTSR